LTEVRWSDEVAPVSSRGVARFENPYDYTETAVLETLAV